MYRMIGIAINSGGKVIHHTEWKDNNPFNSSDEKILAENVRLNCELNNKNFERILTGEAAKEYIWNYDFNSLPEKEQRLINLVFKKQLSDTPIFIRKPVNDILHIAYNTIAKHGFKVTCPRCGGTGKHSFNLRDGEMCWGCHGLGIIRPKLTNKLFKELEKLF